MSGADGFQEGVEAGAVVHFSKVAEFVQHHVILQFLRQGYQPQVQVDIAPSGTASPVAYIVLDEDFIVVETVLGCQFGQPRGQFGLGLGTQRLHLCIDRCLSGLSFGNEGEKPSGEGIEE